MINDFLPLYVPAAFDSKSVELIKFHLEFGILSWKVLYTLHQVNRKLYDMYCRSPLNTLKVLEKCDVI